MTENENDLDDVEEEGPDWNTLYLNCSPSEEPCAAFGQPGYDTLAGIHIELMTAQLKRKLGEPPDGASFEERQSERDIAVDGGSFEVGTLHDLVLVYDRTRAKARAYAKRVEVGFPKKWDRVAKRELKKRLGYDDE